MGLPFFQVDAFTDQAFAGNPAAVCLLPTARPERWLQDVAAEMNLSETAFLVPRADGYQLRWFTPKVEVSLCGHATLASAHVLWETGHLAPGEKARFHTLSGLLTAERQGREIQLDFPARPPEPFPEGDPELAAALGVQPLFVGKNGLDILVEVANETIVRQLQPNFARLATVAARGVIVTSKSTDENFDFVSRFFAPAVGVPEDPVTGSAHCCLGPFWGERLGKTDMLAFQASARGGVVRVGVRSSRVLLSGRAVTVLCGELLA